MSDSGTEQKSELLEPELRDMKIEEGSADVEGASGAERSPSDRPRSASPHSDNVLVKSRFESASQSPSKMEKASQSPATSTSQEEVVGGEVRVKLEPGKAPKLSRTASQKVISRPPPLFDDLPDKTEEATSKFVVLPDCTYVPKYLGETEHALECDCSEEWDSATQTNNACGEDSDCINRATKMECVDDCGCGTDCQNKRFQRKQYADVSVIQTDKKGYGLRTNKDLRANDFIFEYIGEVINESNFRRRLYQYDKEGIKHFYFMSLSKGEFVDATKRGNLGRFCNHSCNPNCYVDKWVIGDKLRMGIFAERDVKAGEELVFNYNVDRYGADPQPCYCGEPNCSGFIGGKTQTDDTTNLSSLTIEALGIEDGDDWDAAMPKRPRKKKLGEADEEYVNNVKPKTLEQDGVTKVMASLRQCKEKWIAVKLLGRIQRVDEERVLSRVVRMHGYQILKAVLTQFMEDSNVALQVLDILHSLPRITKNKIQDAKIEETIQKLASHEDQRVKEQAESLLEIWSKLEIAYRIPRVKADPNNRVKIDRAFDRRVRDDRRSRSRSKSIEPPKGPASKGPGVAAPSGPRSSLPQRHPTFFNGPRPPFRRPQIPTALPLGWLSAIDQSGRTYYYSGNKTQWERPTLPAAQPPPPKVREQTEIQKLDEIIRGITAQGTPKDRTASASATPTAQTPKAEGKDKWRSLPEEKQKKIYKNTLHPHIKHYIDKYKQALPREELKRLGKELSESMTKSDFKHRRVSDPTKLDSTQVKTVRKHVATFFEKAVAKHIKHQKERADKKAAKEAKSQITEASPNGVPTTKSTFPQDSPSAIKDESGDEMDLDEDEDDVPDSATSMSPGLKRKREEEDALTPKKSRFEDLPPPPPPPTDSMPPESPVPAMSYEGVDVADAAYPNGGTPDLDYHSFDSNTQNPVIRTKYSPDDSSNSSPAQLATPPATTEGSCEHENVSSR